MKLECIAWNQPGAPDAAELRKTLESEGWQVLEWSDPPDTCYSPHTHECDESLWVVAGEIAFEVGRQRHALGPGDRLMLPRHTTHTARAGSRGATYLIGQRRG